MALYISAYLDLFCICFARSPIFKLSFSNALLHPTMVATRLPTIFSSAIPNISWPLGPDSSPPLYFESLEELKGRRQSRGSPLEPWLVDLPGTVDLLFPLPSSLGEDGDSLDRRHFGLISMGLVLIGHGNTDECHDLVTPLSWPEDIHFAHGPSVYSTVSSSAKAFATYTHSLVHRREAFHVGEFGMVGFGNADFWSNAVQGSPGVGTLPHQAQFCKRQRVIRPVLG
jgi:hypothetical protein